MFANAISDRNPTDVEELSSLRSAICAPPDRDDAITQALRAADALMSTAVKLIQQGSLEPMTGLPAEMNLSLAGRRTSAEARMLMNAANTLLGMPFRNAAFDRGD